MVPICSNAGRCALCELPCTNPCPMMMLKDDIEVVLTDKRERDIPQTAHDVGVTCRPVDFVAEGIAGVASAQRTGCGLYHVVNPHWEDNVSLDSFLDWIQNAGYPLKRIPDYTQWCVSAPWSWMCQAVHASVLRIPERACTM